MTFHEIKKCYSLNLDHIPTTYIYSLNLQNTVRIFLEYSWTHLLVLVLRSQKKFIVFEHSEKLIKLPKCATVISKVRIFFYIECQLSTTRWYLIFIAVQEDKEYLQYVYIYIYTIYVCISDMSRSRSYINRCFKFNFINGRKEQNYAIWGTFLTTLCKEIKIKTILFTAEKFFIIVCNWASKL